MVSTGDIRPSAGVRVVTVLWTLKTNYRGGDSEEYTDLDFPSDVLREGEVF